MPARSSALPLPPLRATRDGALRRIGVELEMAALELDRLSGEVADFVGGRVEVVTRYEHRVIGDDAGPWQIELDFEFLKAQGRRDARAEKPPSALEEAAQGLLRLGAEQLVPYEVVSPPLPMDQLGRVDALIDRLRGAGARGTTGRPHYAFGMQLNPELPSTEAGTVTAYLAAFLCLYEWLLASARVDLARRLTAFVDPFPKPYVRRVVDPGYDPDLPTLVDDYLAANPTRNRALDLLPLFLELDEDRVRATVSDPRVKPRPALHYRLPNCEIDRPGWGVHEAWGDWLEVERLVAEPERLGALRERYARYLDHPIGELLTDWAEELTHWLGRAPAR